MTMGPWPNGLFNPANTSAIGSKGPMSNGNLPQNRCDLSRHILFNSVYLLKQIFVIVDKSDLSVQIR